MDMLVRLLDMLCDEKEDKISKFDQLGSKCCCFECGRC